MPIYEYECRECLHITEILTYNYNDPHIVRCKACDSIRMRKKISSIGIAMHNKEMISPRDGYKVRTKTQKNQEVKKGDNGKDNNR